jgi:hypothetical protein
MVERWAAAAFALALALAGCAADDPSGDGQPPGPSADTTTAGFQDVATSAATGGITGVVTDEALHPLVDARVAIAQAQQDNATDSLGLFGFAGLEAGAYTLTVEKVGFLAVTQTVSVAAGDVTKVKVVLLAAPSDTSAYHVTYLFRGYIEASAGAASWAVEYALDPDGDTMCACTFTFSVDEHPVDFVIEAVWDEALADDPFGLGYYWDFATAENGNLSNGFSFSPLYVVAMGDEFPPGTLDYKVRLTGPWTWASVSQHYDLFVTVFYREHAPTGWSLVKGDT